MSSIVFFDLDGTLTEKDINNTYHFIELYAKVNRKLFRTLFYYILMRSLPLLSSLHRLLILDRLRISLDSIFIVLMFFGYNINQLMKFSIYWIHILETQGKFKRSTRELINYYKEKNFNLFLLTACSEIPARVLAKYFRFDGCLARRFKTLNGIIVGVKDTEPTSLLKLKFLNDNINLRNTYKIYIVDKASARIEMNLLKLFNKTIIVNQ